MKGSLRGGPSGLCSVVPPDDDEAGRPSFSDEWTPGPAGSPAGVPFQREAILTCARRDYNVLPEGTVVENVKKGRTLRNDLRSVTATPHSSNLDERRILRRKPLSLAYAGGATDPRSRDGICSAVRSRICSLNLSGRFRSESGHGVKMAEFLTYTPIHFPSSVRCTQISDRILSHRLLGAPAHSTQLRNSYDRFAHFETHWLHRAAINGSPFYSGL